MARIGARTQMMAAALGAVVVAGAVALSGLVRADDPGPPATAAELFGGPPGVVLGTGPGTSTAAPTSIVSSTVSSVRPAAPNPTPATPAPAKPAVRPGGFPQPANTGVLPGVALTVVSGDQTFGTSGQVVEGKDFHGFVTVTGKNVTFRNCVFRGRAPTGNAALFDAEKASGTVVEDSEFAPASPTATIDDIWAAHATILRANIHGGVDGAKAGTGTVIQDSWIHDMSWFAHDPNQGGGETHNDGVQSFPGESNVTLRHNTIDMSTTKNANAAWQSSARDSRAENNLVDGGGCTFNFDHNAVGGPLTGISLVGNRFGRHSGFQCPILLSTQTTLAQNSGNVWSDTGGPIPEPQRHD
ncbi:MAG: hypothetical protein ACJ72N_27840 [Labedaea sp.]